jgi:hypothetical protein
MTLKQFIFKKMDVDGYVLDYEVAKFLGREPNYRTVENYKKNWRRLKNDKTRFADEEIIEKIHFNRGYYIRLKGMDKHSLYKVGKDFYSSINIKK